MKTLVESAERFLDEGIGTDVYTLKFVEQDGGKVLVAKNGNVVNASVSDIPSYVFKEKDTIELDEFFDAEAGKQIDINEFCRQHNCRKVDVKNGWSTKNQAWVKYKLVGEVVNDPAFEAMHSYRDSRADRASLEEGDINMFPLERLIKEIAELTDENDHNGAVMVLAQFLKATKHIRIMKAIRDLHDAYGHMPSQLIDLRTYELGELLKLVSQNYGDEIAQKIKGAY